MKLVAAQQERLRLGRQVHTPDPGAGGSSHYITLCLIMSNYCITLEYGVFTSFIWMVIYVDKYVSKRICTEDFAIVVWITLFVCRTGNISCASLTIPSDIRSIRLCCTSALQYRLVQASWTIIIGRSFTLLDWFDGFSAVPKCLYFFSNWKLDCCLAPVSGFHSVRGKESKTGV